MIGGRPEIEVVHPKSHIHRRRLFLHLRLRSHEVGTGEGGGSTLYLHLANLCGRQDEERAATAKEICLASEIHAAKKEAGGTYLVICKM